MTVTLWSAECETICTVAAPRYRFRSEYRFKCRYRPQAVPIQLPFHVIPQFEIGGPSQPVRLVHYLVPILRDHNSLVSE